MDNYPKTWDTLAFALKSLHSWKCEACGRQCMQPGENNKDGRFSKQGLILTVAHVNHVKSDCRLSNLAVLCSTCHLRYDQPRIVYEAKFGRRVDQLGAGQLTLFEPPTIDKYRLINQLAERAGI